jgi:hypothetical protein
VLLVCGAAAWLAAAERSEAQPKYLRVASDVSLSVSCNEPGCDCIELTPRLLRSKLTIRPHAGAQPCPSTPPR